MFTNYDIMISYHLNSQASLTGESWTTEKTADVREDHNTPLLDLKNICFMVSNSTPSPYFVSMKVVALVHKAPTRGFDRTSY